MVEADVFSVAKRSEIMRAVRSKDTKPELVVRRLVFGLGYRYRLHVPSLPGRPDLVFPKRRKVVFVHGCYWHRHSCRRGQSIPGSRTDFWERKFADNRRRDAVNRRKLRQTGWRVLTIWECQTQPQRLQRLAQRLVTFLDG